MKYKARFGGLPTSYGGKQSTPVATLEHEVCPGPVVLKLRLGRGSRERRGANERKEQDAMIDTKIDLDQTDEETLIYEVSDEILESVASTENATLGNLTMLCTGPLGTFC